VHLTFRGARTDRGPGDEIARVLRRDRVHELARRGDAHLDEVEQQAARQAKPVVDAE